MKRGHVLAQIDKPYELDDSDIALAKEFSSVDLQRQDFDAWCDVKYAALKARLKRYHVRAQNRKCAYCARSLGTSNQRVWDLDHVVSRDENAAFTFEPKNLAATCVDCNGSKRATRVLVRRVVKYPRSSNAFKIVHPHFDNYADHIGIFDVVYVGFTQKGRQTIEMCRLWRFVSEALEYDTATITMKLRKAMEKCLKATTPHEEKLALFELRFLSNLPQL